ncbi:MAG: hypothetical protein H6P98_1139 [Candidatus Aminicenantes bacterium]|nr:hypothetical protein [Candidatus Aminicenantes bacterium]
MNSPAYRLGSMFTLAGESGTTTSGPGFRGSSAAWPIMSCWKCLSIGNKRTVPATDQVMVNASRSRSIVMSA